MPNSDVSNSGVSNSGVSNSGVSNSRGAVLVTGVGRRRSIGSGIALGLAADGWNLVLNHWAPYDDRLDYERGPRDVEEVADECRALGRRVEIVAADLADVEAPARLVAALAELGRPAGLVLSHTESVDSSIEDTTLESWDRHFAVNVRASWLLIQAFATHLPSASPGVAVGRVIALTSDHTAHNLPYGASKGALDRLVIAAAEELGPRGLRANVINPGPIDTGWMTDDLRSWCVGQTPAGRLGTSQDIADLVRFLMSDAGAWITGQLLFSNGGFRN